MLVLTRKAQERILIGDNIKVTILRVKGNAVRVGIDAPSDVRVVRGELGAKPSPIVVPASDVAPNSIPAAEVAVACRTLSLDSLAKEKEVTDEACEEASEAPVPRRRAPLAGYLFAAAHAV